MSGPTRSGLLAERVRDIVKAPPTRVTVASKRPPPDSNDRRLILTGPALRCNTCGRADTPEGVALLPLASGWSCSRCLTAAYDRVLAGLPLPEPPAHALMDWELADEAAD